MFDEFDNLEMSPELHPIPSKIPFSESDSPSRRDMNASQLSQAVLIEGLTIPPILTGSEREYAKYTHMFLPQDSVGQPCRAAIRKIVERYPMNRRMRDGFNTATLIIYENADVPGEFGCELIPYNFAIHSQFGYRLIRTDIMNTLRVGQTLPKGAILAHSPAIALGGNPNNPQPAMEMPGVTLNAVFSTNLAGIEDGSTIADDIVDRLATRCYQTVTIGFGKNSIPLNTYGDAEKYKIMADIGEYIRQDAIAIATRRADEEMSLVLMEPTSLMEIDDDFDVPIFIQPNARVVDIEVIRTFPKSTSMLTGMEAQLEWYHDRTLQYYNSILDTYSKIKKDVPNPILTPKLNSLIRRAIAITENANPGSKLTFSKGRAALDEWTVKMTFEYLLVAADGSKLTDGHGGKVVTVRVSPRADMPLDEHGVSADIVLLDEASGNRMNTGRDAQQATTAAAVRLRVELQKLLDNNPSKANYDHAFARLHRYYQIIDRAAGLRIAAHPNPHGHVDHVLKYGIFPQRQYISATGPAETIRQLDKEYDIRGTRITFRNYDGMMVTTRHTALIAPLYMYVLEKVADSAAAVASARMQHFNIPANPSNIDKLSSPNRDNATKILGETETRIIITHTEEYTLAELFDQTTNIVSHTETMFALLEAPNCMQIKKAVDRDKIPLTGGRINAHVRMMVSVSGIKLVNRRSKP